MSKPRARQRRVVVPRRSRCGGGYASDRKCPRLTEFVRSTFALVSEFDERSSSSSCPSPLHSRDLPGRERSIPADIKRLNKFAGLGSGECRRAGRSDRQARCCQPARSARSPKADSRCKGAAAEIAAIMESIPPVDKTALMRSSLRDPPAFGLPSLVGTVARHRESFLSTSREFNAHRDALRKRRRPPCLHADSRLMSLRVPLHAAVLRQGTRSRATSGGSDESAFASPCRDAPARPVPTPGGAG